MPIARVPLTRASAKPWRHPLARRKSLPPGAPTPSISISYRVQGTGPVLVLMVPGMCVPASMYDPMSAVLAATSQFTTILLDNRGMGHSDAPPASLCHAPGYTVHDLASDAWHVIDLVAQDVQAARAASADQLASHMPISHPHPNPSDHSGLGKSAAEDGEQRHFDSTQLHPQVALIGHSMGGMIVQAMVAQRPRDVRFAALLSTHAGGVWNLLPTSRMLTSALRVAWSGFDRDVHAAVNLSLHFTQRFLDAWVVPEWERMTEQKAPTDRGKKRKKKDSYELDDLTGAGDDAMEEPLLRGGSVMAVGYLESKMWELWHDAHIFHGLGKDLTSCLWKPHKAFVASIAKRQRTLRRRRREIYHDKYTGAEPSHPSERAPVEASDSSGSMTHPGDSPYAMYGHAAVVWSHALSSAMAFKLKQCSQLVKLVMTGRHDKVVTPSSSRALADAIGANTVVEVEAAHFITDEAAAEVTTHIIYGLRKAFFAPRNALPCECEWCDEPKEDSNMQASNCRMC
eukprot:GFKZ01005346.1.p1 GENE.GFKZ01005346.1~~GFKZ01005346.1.p1  ORF type:complete len:549 (+),score=56.49 GFKZ01005346.1:110-1648(+)